MNEVIATNYNLELLQSPGPNSFLILRRDGVEVYSMPCVTTEDKDEIILLLKMTLHKRERELRVLNDKLSRVQFPDTTGQ